MRPRTTLRVMGLLVIAYALLAIWLGHPDIYPLAGATWYVMTLIGEVIIDAIERQEGK